MHTHTSSSYYTSIKERHTRDTLHRFWDTDLLSRFFSNVLDEEQKEAEKPT